MKAKDTSATKPVLSVLKNAQQPDDDVSSDSEMLNISSTPASSLVSSSFITFVRDLGIYLDSDVSMRSHVAKTVSTCHATLRQLRTIRRSVHVEIRSPVTGVVSRPIAAGLRPFDTGRRFITSLVTAAVSDERRRSAYFFLVKVPAHHYAPASAALAEGSRADCI